MKGNYKNVHYPQITDSPNNLQGPKMLNVKDKLRNPLMFEKPLSSTPLILIQKRGCYQNDMDISSLRVGVVPYSYFHRYII